MLWRARITQLLFINEGTVTGLKGGLQLPKKNMTQQCAELLRARQ